MPKKNERGDPSVSSAFANTRKKFLAKARTRTRDHWVHRKPSKVCTKKWYIHDGVWSDKKNSHCNSRALFTRKAPTKNKQCLKSWQNYLGSNCGPIWRAKGGLWDFSTSILSRNCRKIEGGPFGVIYFEKKSHNVKKLKRGPFRLARHCMLREKKEKFLVQFARPNYSIWDHNIL